MELEKVEQVAFGGLQDIPWDLIVAVSGYEARAITLAEYLQHAGGKKIVLAYEELKDKLHRPDNDQKFQRLGYEAFPVSESSSTAVEKIMERFLRGSKVPEYVLIDYSCMQKEWYAKILQLLLSSDLSRAPLYVYFSYTPSTYRKPQKHRMKIFGQKKPVFSYTLREKKPLALIMGLGFEKSHIQRIYEQAGDAGIWLCYADPAYDPRFVQELEHSFEHLIAATQESNILRYPLQDFPAIFRSLISLSLDLRIHHTVVLVPFGPKPFFLAALMVTARYPDIQLWFPGYMEDQFIYDWQPFSAPQVCCATFVAD